MVIKKSTEQILKRFRAALLEWRQTKGEIKAYIIPCRDEHSNEYVAPCDDRKAYISGFTGAGVCVVTQDKACVWTDGRFFGLASAQLDENWTLMKRGVHDTPSISNWLMDNLPIGSKIGVDPNLLSYSSFKFLEDRIKYASLILTPIEKNLVDLIWENRPQRPSNPIFPIDIELSGKQIKDKLIEIRRVMKRKKASMLVVSALDEIAWVLNLRGSDFLFNPLFYSYLFIDESSFILFVNTTQITEAVKKHFEKETRLKYYIDTYQNTHSNLKQKSVMADGFVWVSGITNYALTSTIPKEKLMIEPSPLGAAKIIKTPNEKRGMRIANIKDAIAVCCVLHWLEKTVETGTVKEYDVMLKLDEFRKTQELYVNPSFLSTSAFGVHSAIKHYSPRPESGTVITKEDIYLLSSGAHYQDGTSDFTRTMHFGQPTKLQQEFYTRVLKGIIKVSKAVFPSKSKGTALDSYARESLWEAGLDYDHRTAHGVGCFLTAHERGVSITNKHDYFAPGFDSGIFICAEPACYQEGKFGVRLENLLLTLIVETSYQTGRVFLGFDSITQIPFQRKMILMDLLTAGEKNWLNSYHLSVKKKLTPRMEKQNLKEVIEWLNNATEPIKI